MSRTSARETAMKLLYEYGVTGTLSKDSLENAPDVFDMRYIDHIVTGFPEKCGEIDAIISTHSKSWKLERIAKVDLAILRLALYEILFMADIPAKVTINEAVELAKKYSAEKSYQFVNGLLGGYLRSGGDK